MRLTAGRTDTAVFLVQDSCSSRLDRCRQHKPPWGDTVQTLMHEVFLRTELLSVELHEMFVGAIFFTYSSHSAGHRVSAEKQPSGCNRDQIPKDIASQSDIPPVRIDFIPANAVDAKTLVVQTLLYAEKRPS